MDNSNNTYWWEINFDPVTESPLHSGTDSIFMEECIHEWTKYEGFTDAFEYCIKCDIKNR
jgi:hypothetical protein